MSFDNKIQRLIKYRIKTKKEHRNHLKRVHRTRAWHRKAILLKKKRSVAKKTFKKYQKKLTHIKKYREHISQLQKEYNELEVLSSKDVNIMYNSLENIATCSNHTSVQHFLRQSINAYVREQPNRFQNSLTHVWAYDNSSKHFNTLDKKVETCQTQMDITRIKLSMAIKELE